MKAHVWVLPKATVLDPQGQAVERALRSLGFDAVRSVRQGKLFVVELNGVAREEAARQVDEMARRLLANPVIEDYRIELLD
jgi:phosphoribosylformylglycinamidine synthase PurS subunit